MDNKLNALVEEIVKFRDDRNWKQFHNPKDIALSISIEAAELLECFQWKNNKEIEEIIKTDKKIEIEHEIADIGNYLLLLCHELNIDFVEIIKDKLYLNEKKYPVEKIYGSNKKYTEIE